MAGKSAPVTPSDIVGDATVYTFEELCITCRVEGDWIAAAAEHGIVAPAGATRSEWVFPATSVVRIARAKRLERDLGLNVPGVALVLELLNEIDRLECQLKALQQGEAGDGDA